MTAKQKRRQRRQEDRLPEQQQQPEPEVVEIVEAVPKIQYIKNPCPVCNMAGLRRAWTSDGWQMICYRCKYME